MLKKLSIVFIVICTISVLFSCKKKLDYSNYKASPPEKSVITGDYDLDFVEMHNFVIDYISEEMMPFFFVKNNSFDISGSNEEKSITIKCICSNGTTIHDLDLFLSMVLNGIGINASEQDYRFAKPSTSTEGYYTDFGSVFSIYSLQIDAKDEGGNILRNENIKANGTIPVDPKYIME